MITNPAMICLYTQRPVIRTPNNLQFGNFQEYADTYEIRYALDEGEDSRSFS